MKEENSYGFVVVHKGQKGDRFLLVHQATKNWSFPKGHPEGAETPVETARRELFEECGLSDISIIPDITFTEQPFVFSRDGIKIKKTNSYFLATTTSEILRPQPNEILECRFVLYDEALSLFSFEQQKETLKKAREVIK